MGFENISIENFLVFLRGPGVKLRSGCPQAAERREMSHGLSQPLEGIALPSLCLWSRNFVGISSGKHQGLELVFLRSLFPPMQSRWKKKLVYSSKRLSDLIRLSVIYDIISFWPLSTAWIYNSNSWNEAETFSSVFLICREVSWLLLGLLDMTGIKTMKSCVNHCFNRKLYGFWNNWSVYCI